MANPKRKFHPLPLPSFKGKLLVSGSRVLISAISGILKGNIGRIKSWMSHGEPQKKCPDGRDWHCDLPKRDQFVACVTNGLKWEWMDLWWRITLGDNSPHRPVIFHQVATTDRMNVYFQRASLSLRLRLLAVAHGSFRGRKKWAAVFWLQTSKLSKN